jgi:hypothetical protein
LIQAHPGFFVEVRKLVAIIAAEIAIFGDLDHKLWRNVNGHRLHYSTIITRSGAAHSAPALPENLLSLTAVYRLPYFDCALGVGTLLISEKFHFSGGPARKSSKVSRKVTPGFGSAEFALLSNACKPICRLALSDTAIVSTPLTPSALMFIAIGTPLDLAAFLAKNYRAHGRQSMSNRDML